MYRTRYNSYRKGAVSMNNIEKLYLINSVLSVMINLDTADDKELSEKIKTCLTNNDKHALEELSLDYNKKINDGNFNG